MLGMEDTVREKNKACNVVSLVRVTFIQANEGGAVIAILTLLEGFHPQTQSPFFDRTPTFPPPISDANHRLYAFLCLPTTLLIRPYTSTVLGFAFFR
ncbi:unnamed protein product [Sphenostylis stenocarpa]|uniref:Uncharacterized protein n=1 Tax=Sphenostylis stenocarpa TaxID=92480 RepID=A0AA86T4C1_9FABA|nr:unnamed protein product [Sphenostylis stenocarpa]